MAYQRQTIPINCLLLDTENARHGSQDDQSAVLKWMASQAKVIALARSVATYGLSPSELPIVIPAGDDQEELYWVVEGNRRTAVLKLLHDPEKCPDERTRKQFRKLRSEALVAPPQELECVVFPDLPSAAHWIELRHLGEQEGAGTVPWGAKENEFFARRMGQRGPNEPGLKLMEYAKENGLITEEQFDVIPLTNVTRLVNSPDVRRELGLNIKRGEPLRVADQGYFNRAVGGMLRALSSGEWSVSKLKNQDQRKAFVKKVKGEQNWGSYEVRDEAPLASEANDVVNEHNDEPGSTQDHAAQNGSKSERSSKNSLSRKTAIASSTSMKIQSPKLLAVFRELKRLDVDEFPNAAAVLTRVFIEGCADLYMQKKGLPINSKATLADKVKDVRKSIIDLNTSHPQVRHDLKGLETFSESPMSIGSANTFNAVVHNPKFSITPSEIKENWNRLEPCLKWFVGHV